MGLRIWRYIMNGHVLWGSKNIYLVETDNGILECRFKGKKLKGTEREYNPLSPGDQVVLEIDEADGSGMITERLERTRTFKRWNKKRKAYQSIAANVDSVFIVASLGEPPFRPRFIDRVLIACAIQEVPAEIVINKIDLGMNELEEERIRHFQKWDIRFTWFR
jgi:ribosome biogenesis GTPase